MRLWRLFKSQCYIQTSWVFNTNSLSILSLAPRGEIIGGQTLRAGQHVPLGGRNPGDKVCLPSLITCSWDFASGRTGWFYPSPWRSRTCTPPMSGAGEACEGRWPKPKTTENPMKNPAQSKTTENSVEQSGSICCSPNEKPVEQSGSQVSASVGRAFLSVKLRQKVSNSYKLVTDACYWQKVSSSIKMGDNVNLENELPQVKAGGTRPEVLDFSLGNITKPKVKCCPTITLQWTMIWQ